MFKNRGLITFVLALLSILSFNISGQNIPEQVRIKQYLNKRFKDAVPQANGLYIIKSHETNGKLVSSGDTVTVNYEGSLLNERVFDSSYRREKPISFVVGTGQMIAGWEEGIATMRQGEIVYLIIPSKLAYGDQQVGQIPPNSPLVFKIELLKIGN